MSEQTTAESRPQAGWRRLPPWLLPGAVGVVLAVLATGVWRQLAHPFLEHDDWEFLLPATDERIEQHHNRLLAEGRWFNYAWYRVIGQHLPPRVAALLFVVAVLLVAVRLAWRWAPGRAFVPVLVAIATWPMVLDLGYWPATMAPSILLLGGAAWTIPYCVGDRRRLLLWVAGWTLLEFLAYPALTAILLVILVVELVDRPWRELAAAVGTFVAAYGVSTGVVFSLNGAILGTFGVQARPWRNPNPVHGLGDLVENLGRVIDLLDFQIRTAPLPLAIAIAGVAGCLAAPALRERGYRLAVLMVLGLGLQFAPTVLTGVNVPFRATGWVWLVPIVALAWLLESAEVKRWLRVGAAVTLVLLLGWGARYDLKAVDHNQDRRETYEALIGRVVQLAGESPGARILVVGRPDDYRNPVFTQEVQYLSQKALHDHGLVLRPCAAPGCLPATRPRVVQRADDGLHVFRAGLFIIVVPTAYAR